MTQQTGRASFRDGPSEPRSAAAAALAAHPVLHPDGEFERVQTLPEGYNYSVQRHDGATYLMRRPTKPEARTADADEWSRLKDINARNKEFWQQPTRPAGR